MARIALITPALASGNNGNWQTAKRWRGFLSPLHQVHLAQAWHGGDEDLMLALHARRSAASVQAWKQRHPTRPLVLVLTGTDLYQDIARDASAQASLALADVLVVLNDRGAQALPPPQRDKAVVILQSCSAWQTVAKTSRRLRALMVGHLRPEKDPDTYWRAAALLAHRPDLQLLHIGGALDDALAAQARAVQDACPHYRWLGALSHAQARRHIQRAHVLVHPSRLEGGAHVVIEALCSGTAVLASRMEGNCGLLGNDYPGYFEVGDAEGLAEWLVTLREDASRLHALSAAGEALQARFTPEQEAQAVQAVVARCLRGAHRR